MLQYTKPVSALNMEELAARQRSIRGRGGVAFARHDDGEGKVAARNAVLDIFHPDKWPGGLHMLTLPGAQWRFERKLLGMREEAWTRKYKPSGTYLTCCESDHAIFHAACAQMPGLHNSQVRLTKTKRKLSFAQMGVKTNWATLFLANIDDMVSSEEWTWEAWDAAWLDYTGPLTLKRLGAIQKFFAKYIKDVLIVTALKARWDSATSRAIDKSGGHSELFREYVDGEIIHDIEYCDTSPMAQIAVRKSRLLIDKGE